MNFKGKAIEVNSLYQVTLQASASPCQRGSTRSRTLRPALRTKVDSSSIFFISIFFMCLQPLSPRKLVKFSFDLKQMFTSLDTEEHLDSLFDLEDDDDDVIVVS